MPFSTAGVTLADCNSMYANKRNPINNLEISETQKAFKNLHHHCQQLQNKDYIQDIVHKWIINPLQDPIDKKKISPRIDSESTYAKLYVMAYNLFKEQNMPIMDIKEKLPDNHLLFNGNIDILFYIQVKDDPDHPLYFPYDHSSQQNKYVYDIILQNNILSNYEKEVTKYLSDIFVECLQQYVFYAIYILFTDIDEMSSYVNDINKYYIKLEHLYNFISDVDFYSSFFKIIKKRKTIHSEIQDFLMKDNFLRDIYNNQEVTAINMIIGHIFSTNIFHKLLDYYGEIYDTYNYQSNPLNSPFKNLDHTPLTPIEDPLITILEKIGIKNIDLETLKIPDRLFKNDDEYNKYLNRYKSLKSKYKKKVNEWKEYSTSRSELKLPITTPPKKPVMQLPNNTLLNVVNQLFPYHIKDQEYQTIVKTYNDNKHVISMYQSIMNKGILDLLRETNASPSRISASQNASELIDKDRQYFLENILKSSNATDAEPNKCVQNTDLTSTDQLDFDDKEYPLAKLQLMFKLVSTINGKQFIYCFYAPNFYNHILTRINERKKINNPATNKILTNEEVEKAIDDLMKIMKVIVPNIQRPELIHAPYDEMLTIKHTEILHDGFSYYEIYISRIIGDIEFIVFNLCVIPGDLEIENTRTSGATSAVFLSKLYDLFNDGGLLYTYLPPYCFFDDHNNPIFIKENIHFNNYRTLEHWIQHSREEQIRLFLHYLGEISNFV